MTHCAMRWLCSVVCAVHGDATVRCSEPSADCCYVPVLRSLARCRRDEGAGDEAR